MEKEINIGWEKEFDAKVKELKDQRPVKYRDSEPVEFGFSCDMGEELHRVVDFGNIKKFISRIIASETAKERVKVVLKGERRRVIEQIRAEENERCAMIVEEHNIQYDYSGTYDLRKHLAARIRSTNSNQ